MRDELEKGKDPAFVPFRQASGLRIQELNPNAGQISLSWGGPQILLLEKVGTNIYGKNRFRKSRIEALGIKRKLLGWRSSRAARGIAKNTQERMIRIISIILAFMREATMGHTPFTIV